MREIAVTFQVTEEQEQRLEKLLPYWVGYVSADGCRPFQSWTIEDQFKMVMATSSRYTIDRHISSEEIRQEIIAQNETPAVGAAGESMSNKYLRKEGK